MSTNTTLGGWGRGTWGSGAWNSAVPVSATGLAGTSALGTVTVAIDISTAVTGLEGTSNDV